MYSAMCEEHVLFILYIRIIIILTIVIRILSSSAAKQVKVLKCSIVLIKQFFHSNSIE